MGHRLRFRFSFRFRGGVEGTLVIGFGEGLMGRWFRFRGGVGGT